MKRGHLITFEGGEGSGKSTQIRLLQDTLCNAGIDVVATREPGGTREAEAIRDLLLQGTPDRWSPMSELLLVLAARYEHVMETVAPALAKGAWVICDRFADSTRVYQGIAGGLGLEIVDRLHELVLGDVEPDLTLVLDVSVDEGLRRRRQSGVQSRFDRMSADYHELVRRGFLDLAARETERCVLVNGAYAKDAVASEIRAALRDRLAAPI